MERAWGDAVGRPVRIADAREIAGGCISPVLRLRSGAGDLAFLKWDDRLHAGRMLEEEARSLRALEATGKLRVPHVFAWGGGAREAAAWLLLEWLEPGTASDSAWRDLGLRLAAVHRVRAAAYGWERDNFIGPLPQRNSRCSVWSSFWAEHRIEPRLRAARAAGHLDAGDGRRFDRLLREMDRVLTLSGGEGPSLLHGDLWSGNVHHAASGVCALVDPACYYGHREVDLAMAELFGGFPPAFFAAYDEAWSLEPGYAEQRRPVYQLYYLLVHVTLFGSSYVPAIRAALARAGF